MDSSSWVGCGLCSCVEGTARAGRAGGDVSRVRMLR